jgi:hypothetical protein
MFQTGAGAGLWRWVVAVAVAAAMMLMHMHQGIAADSKSNAKTKAPAAKQKTYAAPEEGVKDLMAAAKAGDSRALLAILGPEAKPILSSGDAVADREGRERFVKSYDEANRLE